jgi:hypothetical protein
VSEILGHDLRFDNRPGGSCPRRHAGRSSPPERLAFGLHDMFAVPFDEIAPIVDRSPEAARQLASRARRRVQGENTLPDADLDTQRKVADAFLGGARRRLRGAT